MWRNAPPACVQRSQQALGLAVRARTLTSDIFPRESSLMAVALPRCVPLLRVFPVASTARSTVARRSPLRICPQARSTHSTADLADLSRFCNVRQMRASAAATGCCCHQKLLVWSQPQHHGQYRSLCTACVHIIVCVERMSAWHAHQLRGTGPQTGGLG